MDRLARLSGSRARRWAVVGVWVAVIAIFAPLGKRLPDVVNDDYTVPSGSQTGQLQKLLATRFPGGDERPLVLVYRRPGGLTAADRRAILGDAVAAAALPDLAQPIAPFTPKSPPGLVSAAGDVAVTIVPLRVGKILRVRGPVDDLRALQKRHPGLELHVTGFSALVADVNSAIKEADVKLLGATVALVLVLLMAVYRAPLLAFLPLLVVGLAYAATSGILYGLNKAFGLPIDSVSSSLLLVLMFGAGTDYCLLLVARYRAALRRHESARDAMLEAIPEAAPAMIASGMTVIAALLVMLSGVFGVNRTLGPVNAIGVGVVLVASLTLLPALLTLFGRRAFWPTAGSVAVAPDDAGETSNRGWRRFAGAVRRRPALWLALGVALLVGLAFGTLTLKSNMSPVAQFRKATDATRGYEVLRSAFPAGALAPTSVLVERRNGVVRPEDLAAVERRIRAVGDVRAIQDGGRRSRDGRVAQLSVVFADDPFREPALDRIGALRSTLRDTPGSPLHVLVGQGSGERVDYRAGAWRDAKVIGPLVLAVVLLTLILLLVAAVAPLYLLLTVILSFLGSLGAALIVFNVLGQGEGVDPLIPLLIFIFLVALGSDYNIFLMSRAREEAARYGTAEGTFRAVVATGPVITSAGLILAGTFSILAVLPVWPLAEVGLGVALGVLIDTFLVRSICVPAVAWLLGDRIWWPARAGRGGELPPVAAPTTPSA